MCIWWSKRDKQQDIRVTTNTTVLESKTLADETL